MWKISQWGYIVCVLLESFITEIVTTHHKYIYKHTWKYNTTHIQTHVCMRAHAHTYTPLYSFLQELASHSQHTYLYTQVVLQAMSSFNEDDSNTHHPHISQWLSQQLLKHNLAKYVIQISLCLYHVTAFTMLTSCSVYLHSLIQYFATKFYAD